MSLLGGCRLRLRSGDDIVCHAIARQVQVVDGVHNRVGVEVGVGIIARGVEREMHGARQAHGEVRARAIVEKQVFAARLRVCAGVVVLMKLRVRRTMKRRISSRQSSAYVLFSKAVSERTGHWWCANKLRLAQFAKQLLRANAQVAAASSVRKSRSWAERSR